MSPAPRYLSRCLCAALALAFSASAFAAETFVFRGQLDEGNTPAQGSYALRLTLYPSPHAVVPLAGPLELLDVPLAEGRFAVEADFGQNLPSGTAWLQVEARAKDDAYYLAVDERSPVKLGSIPAGACPAAWELNGNAGTNPATNFLGTTDAQAFEIRTANARSLRIESSTQMFGGQPITRNVIAGSHANSVDSLIRGATIAGGGLPVGDSDPQFGEEAPNRVSGHYGVVGGGYGNIAGNPTFGVGDDGFSTVSGGRRNTAGGLQSVIGGGYSNTASGENSVIGGGYSNTASGESSVVGGGNNNAAAQSYATLGGGKDNIADGIASTVSGGSTNTADGQNSTVGGGYSNVAGAINSTVSGGSSNTAGAPRSTVGGGASNNATGVRSTISGGENNGTSGEGGVVGGGFSNIAAGLNSTVAGGVRNTSGATRSTVGGGADNSATATGSTVSGGINNETSGQYSTVVGGRTNASPGEYSLVAGGQNNCAGSPHSFAGGYRAKVKPGAVVEEGPCSGLAPYPISGHAGSFVWADATERDFTSTTANQFSVQATGGARIVTGYSLGITEVGVRLNSGDTAWSALSDRNSKTGIEAVDAQDVLTRVLELPVYTWHYRHQHEGIRHIGPMAQDFHAAFGLNGDDDKHISTIDPDGVALAAIQGLNEKLEAEVAALREELAALRALLMVRSR